MVSGVAFSHDGTPVLLTDSEIIEFDESIRGTTITIPLASRVVCPTCGGAGRTGAGRRGSARACRKCGGDGVVRSSHTVKARIPRGARDGSRVRVPGGGDAGRRGGPPGDLYVVLHVQPHAIFQREANHIICEIPISMVQAALGTKIDVPTLEGVVKMTIPEGTQTGRLFRMREKGIRDLRSGRRGDQIVRVVVEIPQKLNKKQKQLLKDFEKLDAERSESLVAGFAGKVRELFG